jgi:long-chain fatty acid transport protein
MKRKQPMERLAPRILGGGARLGCALLSCTAQAGGIALYEIGTPDVGLASAGYAARAADASTLFKNPAGMSRLDGAQLQTGLQPLYGSVTFSPDANTSPLLGADDGGNAIGWLPGGSLFVTVPLGEDWTIGLGSLSYFGLAEEYNDNWVGRYYVQESALVGMTLMPAVSYQATDWLSIGVGLNAMYGLLEADMAVNRRFLNPLLEDGRMTLDDRTWGFGANVGVLIQASEKTRFGITYLSAVDLDFKDTPSFANFAPANPRELDLGMTVPQSVMLSVYRLQRSAHAVSGAEGIRGSLSEHRRSHPPHLRRNGHLPRRRSWPGDCRARPEGSARQHAHPFPQRQRRHEEGHVRRPDGRFIQDQNPLRQRPLPRR